MNLRSNGILTQKRINELSDFFNVVIVVFNQDKILYTKNTFQSLVDQRTIEIDDDHINYIVDSLNNDRINDICIKINDTFEVYFDAIVNEVNTQDGLVKFAMLHEVEKPIQATIDDNQLAKLRQLIIEISQSVLGNQSLNEFLNFVLKSTIQALDHAETGTIMALKDEVFSVVASFGYDDNIKRLTIPKEKSLSYQLTNGAFDKIINIKDSSVRDYTLPKQTRNNKEVIIRSTLSAPIYIEGKFYGMIGLDSFKKNAFDQADIEALEFIRNSIQIAITNQVLFKEKAYLSQYDQVTSLHNRHYFQEHSEYIIKKAERYNESFYVVMVDIDNLKQTNDTHGHIVGDLLIQKVSNMIKNSMKESDVFARYGGDEFVGLMFHTTASAIQNKLCELDQYLINNPIQYNHQPIFASFSYGIAKFPDDGKSISALINVADKKMYACKLNK